MKGNDREMWSWRDWRSGVGVEGWGEMVNISWKNREEGRLIERVK